MRYNRLMPLVGGSWASLKSGALSGHCQVPRAVVHGRRLVRGEVVQRSGQVRCRCVGLCLGVSVVVGPCGLTLRCSRRPPPGCRVCHRKRGWVRQSRLNLGVRPLATACRVQIGQEEQRHRQARFRRSSEAPAPWQVLFCQFEVVRPERFGPAARRERPNKSLQRTDTAKVSRAWRLSCAGSVRR